MTSSFSDDVVPHLSEPDARRLITAICERVLARGAAIRRCGVHLDHDGLWFAAVVNGKEVTARTGQGNFTYDEVARDLILASTDPGWNRLRLLSPDPVGLKAWARKGWDRLVQS